MLCNRNLTKFNILTFLRSHFRAWALKVSKHLKKQQNICLSSFYQLHLYCNFLALSSLPEKKIISYLHSLLNLCDEYHLKISKTVIKLVKSDFTFPWNELDALVFFLFNSHNQKPKQNHQYLAVEQKQDQHKFRHVWSRGVI